TNSFLVSSSDIDFTYAVFEGAEACFDNTVFVAPKINFANAHFRTENVSFSYCHFKVQRTDFSYSFFKGNSLSFKNAVFIDGVKDFRYIDVEKANINFVNTDFGHGDVFFINAQFGTGDVSFKVATFGDGAKDFHYARFFGSDVSFERCRFGNGLIDFSKVEFGSQKVSFNRAEMGKVNLNFEGCEQKTGRFNFKKVLIQGGSSNFSLVEMPDTEAVFSSSDIGMCTTSFHNSAFKSLFLQSCHFDCYIDLRVKKADFLDLSDSIVRDIVDLMPYDWTVDIKSVNFEGMRLVGRMYLSWDKNRVKSMINNQPNLSNRSKCEQFRVLKQNFNVTGQYTDEDKAYVEFRRHEMAALLDEMQQKSTLKSFFYYPVYWFKKIVFDYMGLYATSPSRVLISVVVCWFLFGFGYFFIELLGVGKTMSGVGNPDNISVFAQSFYHSAITFFTIGYGDVFPMGVSRLFSALEGFLGVFMMSYFTVAFVRKILR
ncbi:MAG TPA: potassium channel family protein, partial [Bacteroidales bacterium]